MTKHTPLLNRYGTRNLPNLSNLSTGQYFAVVHGSFGKPEHLAQACGFPILSIQSTNHAVEETSLTFMVPDADGIRRLAYWLHTTNKSNVIPGSILYLKRMPSTLRKRI